MDFKLGELFCGPGGIAVGALSSKVLDDEGELFSISHGWANDYDKDTCETYTKNICPDSPESVICKDVRKLDINKLSPPCNDFTFIIRKKVSN